MVGRAVRTVMTQDVVVARASAWTRDVAELMRALRLRLLPVVDGDGLCVGVVSVDDLAEHGLAPGANGRRRGRRTAGAVTAVMTRPAITVDGDATIAAAARAMVDHGVRALPVVDGGGRLEGIVTDADLVTTMVRGDDDVAADVTATLRRYLPTVATSLTTTVADGVVTLTGSPSARWAIPLAVHLIRSTVGVVTVENRLDPHREGHEPDESPWWSRSGWSRLGEIDTRTP